MSSFYRLGLRILEIVESFAKAFREFQTIPPL